MTKHMVQVGYWKTDIVHAICNLGSTNHVNVWQNWVFWNDFDILTDFIYSFFLSTDWWEKFLVNMWLSFEVQPIAEVGKFGAWMGGDTFPYAPVQSPEWSGWGGGANIIDGGWTLVAPKGGGWNGDPNSELESSLFDNCKAFFVAKALASSWALTMFFL